MESIHIKITHIPNDTTAYAFRGTRRANHGPRRTFIALVPNEYIVGAHALGTVSATSTVRRDPRFRSAESECKFGCEGRASGIRTQKGFFFLFWSEIVMEVCTWVRAG